MAKQSLMVGIDLGGTKMDIGFVDPAGKIVRRHLLKTKSKEGPQAIIDDIVGTVRELLSQNSSDQLLGMGIGIAGQIEKNTGIVRFAPNLGWKDFPLQDELSRQLHLPVSITNDVRAATWGEWLHGAGKGCCDLICLFLGTGLGGGIISGGQMLVGATNSAGEIGHFPIQVHGPLCHCGNHGCFEALASGWALAQRVKELIIEDKVNGNKLIERAGGKLEDVTAKQVFEGCRERNPIALKVYEELKEVLVAGVTGLANTLNPEKIILGGGIIDRNPELVEVVCRGVPKHALKVATQSLKISATELKADAGVIGAADFARKQQGM